MRVVQISSTPPFSPLQDIEVIQKVLSGEKGLFEILLRRNNQKLYRVLRGYLTDHDEVVDTMQDTYVTAYEKLDQFRQSAQFSTWLIRIGINKALRRINQSRKVVSIEELNESQFQSNQQPELKYMQAEAKQTLEMAIGSLAEKYRSAYIMKEVEGMSIAEISDCLEITQSNVKVRIHRAKSLIKDKLYQLSASTDIYEFGNKKCDVLTNSVMNLI